VIVTQLQLRDWRNYAEAEVELAPGPNLLVGSNGQGKTNLVESIVYLSSLGSHRVSGDAALIRHGAESAIVRARLAHDDRSVLLELQLNRSAPNRAQLNRGAIRPRELPRHVASVIFAPEDLALVRGDPAGRRRFLDQLLVQDSPRIAGVLADYERVLRQRTSLLKTARAARRTELPTLDIWDGKLVELGTEIVVARGGLVERLRPHVATAYREIAGAEQEAELALRLSILGARPDDEDRDDEVAAPAAPLDAESVAREFRSALAERRRAELERGLSLVGPHRDDLLLTLNGLPARGYASHGESWSFALALRLASAAVLREDAPLGDPVLILDDVFAELDQARRGRLAAAVADYEQVLVTAAVLEDVPEGLARSIVRIHAGRIITVGNEAADDDAAGEAE